jgi:hypothetical protein
MTRQMKNIRTGKIAVYDADLIEGGRWEEYIAPKEKPTLKVGKLKAKGALEVKQPESENESIEPKA